MEGLTCLRLNDGGIDMPKAQCLPCSAQWPAACNQAKKEQQQSMATEA